MLRVGVVGVGAMGSNHTRVLKQLEEEGLVELVGVVDIRREVAEAVARRFRTKAFTSVDELLREGIDAATVAVPTTVHRDVALKLIEGGVEGVLIEKPIADSLEAADEIIEAAKAHGVKVMVGHIERFNPAVRRLKEVIRKGLLGTVVFASARRVGPFSPRVRDVDVIVDLGVHDIDIICYLYDGRPATVYARGGTIIHTHGLIDHAVIVMGFPRDRSGAVEVNWLTPYKVRRLIVTGTEGVAELDYIEQRLWVHNAEWTREALIKREEPLRLELESFVRCLIEKRAPPVTGEDGREALRIALAALESLRSGRVVELS